MYDRFAMRAQFETLVNRYGGVTEEQFRHVVRKYKPQLEDVSKDDWTAEDWDALLCEYFLEYVDDYAEGSDN